MYKGSGQPCGWLDGGWGWGWCSLDWLAHSEEEEVELVVPTADSVEAWGGAVATAGSPTCWEMRVGLVDLCALY